MKLNGKLKGANQCGNHRSRLDKALKKCEEERVPERTELLLFG